MPPAEPRQVTTRRRTANGYTIEDLGPATKERLKLSDELREEFRALFSLFESEVQLHTYQGRFVNSVECVRVGDRSAHLQEFRVTSPSGDEGRAYFIADGRDIIVVGYHHKKSETIPKAALTRQRNRVKGLLK